MEDHALALAPPDSPDAAPVLAHFVARAAQLYSLPTVAAEVLQLTGSGEVDRSALKACIENDPGLTTRILKVVNSSLFGVTRKVTDLGQAIALLGVKPLKMLVLGFSLPSELVAQTEKEVLTQYWRHTLLKAAACREISRCLFPARGDEAFLAGLLQDVGELVLIQQLGATYSRFRNQVSKDQRPLREAQSLALGFDHVELSARLLDRWGLPASFTAVVEGKWTGNESSGDQALLKVLKIAEQMASVVEADKDQVLLTSIARSELGLSSDQVQEILTGLMLCAEELAKILSLELPPRGELSIAAHARLAEATVQMLEGASEQALIAETMELRSQLQAAISRPTSLPPASPPKQPAAPLRTATQTCPANLDLSAIAANQQLVCEVTAAISRCRGGKQSLSLVLIQAHGVVTRDGGPSAYPQPQRLLRAMEQWSQDRGTGLVIAPSSFALLWEDCKRSEGSELARHLLRLAQESSHSSGGSLAPGWMLSAGLATLTLPSRNFPPHELIAAAERCLSGALLSGGTVKSIEF